jgi:hypothetical protein
MRSPNFPGIPLEQAVTLAGAIFKQNRQNLISRETAAKDLGYSGLTGRSMKLLGAMNQFGLIENKAGGNMRVTDVARDILHGIEPEHRIKALHEAGNSPTLFRAIFDRFPDGVPSENAVRSFMVQSGFTDRGVDAALSSFMETNRYLELQGVSESYGDSDENEQESPAPQSRGQENSPMHRTTERPTPPPAARAADGPLHFTYSMDDVITVSGSARSPRELQNFLDKLSKAMAMLPPHIEEDDDSEANGQ